MWPARREIDWPIETRKPRNIGIFRDGQAPGRHDAEPRDIMIAGIGRNAPRSCGIIVDHALDARIELHVPTQVERVRHELGIAKDFRLRRVFFRPGPRLLNLLRKGEGIVDAHNIAPRAGIAVPVPGAPYPAGRLDHADTHAARAQAVEHIHARKACADDDRVEAFISGWGFRHIIAHPAFWRIFPERPGQCFLRPFPPYTGRSSPRLPISWRIESDRD